jgi:hypothetical protein
VLAKYKHEVKGPLDFSGAGVNRKICGGGARVLSRFVKS